MITHAVHTPLSPLAGCGPVGEGTSVKVLNWTVHSLYHLPHHQYFVSADTAHLVERWNNDLDIAGSSRCSLLFVF